jgi:hypothetical protein
VVEVGVELHRRADSLLAEQLVVGEAGGRRVGQRSLREQPGAKLQVLEVGDCEQVRRDPQVAVAKHARKSAHRGPQIDRAVAGRAHGCGNEWGKTLVDGCKELVADHCKDRRRKAGEHRALGRGAKLLHCANVHGVHLDDLQVRICGVVHIVIGPRNVLVAHAVLKAGAIQPLVCVIEPHGDHLERGLGWRPLRLESQRIGEVVKVERDHLVLAFGFRLELCGRVEDRPVLDHFFHSVHDQLRHDEGDEEHQDEGGASCAKAALVRAVATTDPAGGCL